MNFDEAACYEILGLPFNSPLEEVKKARRLLAKKHHPDLFHGFPKLRREGEEKLKRINVACDILESRRAAKINTQQEDEECRRARAASEMRKSEEERARSEREAKRSVKRKEKARTKELRKTFLKFHRLAKQNFAEAQFRLAILYRNGHGCVQDKTEAMRWFKKASTKGYPRALLYLGFAFAWGIDRPAQLSKAIELYEVAAEKEYPEAYFHLGFMYYFGLGVKLDFETAAKLYRKAVKQGYIVSEPIADTCDHLRTETPKNYFKQYKWYVMNVKRASFE